MRVLHLTLSFHSAPSLGGPDLTSYKLCRALTERGVEIEVICTNLASKTDVIQPGSFERQIDGMRVRYLETKKLFPLGRNSFGLFVIPELNRILSEEVDRFDLVHLTGYRDFQSVVGSYQAKQKGIPYLIHPRGTIPYQGHSLLAKFVFDKTLGRRMIKGAAAFIALSQRETHSYRALGADMSRVYIVHNGIEVKEYRCDVNGDTFRRKHNIKEKNVVLYFGRIHFTKGIDQMLRAVAHLARAGVDIAAVVVGPDEGYRSYLIDLAKKLDFRGLYFIPTVSGEEKQQVFGAADILVYAAKFEEFGVSAFEGVLSGVPTIVTRGTGCGEIMQGFDAGYLVDYGDIEGMSRTISSILEDPKAAKARTLKGRENVIRSLPWSEIGRKVHEIYSEILK
jgi:glycosyltransferase involved in cell wall biosynthesis